MIDPSKVELWKSHPITKQLYKTLEHERKRLWEQIEAGTITQETMAFDNKRLGMIETMMFILTDEWLPLEENKQ